MVKTCFLFEAIEAAASRDEDLGPVEGFSYRTTRYLAVAGDPGPGKRPVAWVCFQPD